MFFVGIELGIRETSAVLVDIETAEVISRRDFKHGITKNKQGAYHQDPTVWVMAIDELIETWAQEIEGAAARICGLGVTSPPELLVTLDRNNQVLKPVHSAPPQATKSPAYRDLLLKFGGPPGWMELAGRLPDPHSIATQLHHLQREEPQAWSQLRTAFPAHDFINYWLTGVKRTDFSSATLSGLSRIDQPQWAGQVLDYVTAGHGPDILPAIGTGDRALGELRDDLRRKWGLEQPILVSPGGAAPAMHMLGAGITNAQTGMLDFTGKYSTPQLQVPAYTYAYDTIGEFSTSAGAVEGWIWSAQLLNMLPLLQSIQRAEQWNHAQLEHTMLACTTPAEGITLIVDEGSERELIVGLQPEAYSPHTILQAALETQGQNLWHKLERGETYGMELKELVIAGANSPVWRQKLADMSGLPVRAARPDLAAIGAALQAGCTYFRESGEDLTAEELTSYVVLGEIQSCWEPDIEQTIVFHQKWESMTS